MKAKRTTLTPKDLANIKTAVESVSLASNREHRRKIAQAERELKVAKAQLYSIGELYMAQCKITGELKAEIATLQKQSGNYLA